MQFFIRVLFISILITYFSSEAALSEDDKTPLPTSLFRIQINPDYSFYVLGSIHTKNRETYPRVVHDTIRQIHQSGGHLFTEVLFEENTAEIEKILKQFSMETYVDGLKASALLHGKEEGLMAQWAEIYRNLIQTQYHHVEEKLKSLLLTYVPHPLFLNYFLELEEGCPSDTSQQGIDYSTSELFSKENKYSLESEDIRLSLALEEDHLKNFLIFEDTVRNLIAQMAQSQPVIPPSPQEAGQKEKVMEEADREYKLFLSNPLYKVPSPDFVTLEERNQLWRAKLDEILSTPHHQRPLLIVVGAFHLGGPTGLLQYFHQKGIPIFQIHEDKEHQFMEREFWIDPALFNSPPHLS